MVVVLMSMSWFMVFQVNETYGYPLTANRMLKYKNKVLSLDNKNPKKKHVIKEITPAEVVPAGKSQEGDHTELFTLWKRVWLHAVLLYSHMQSAVVMEEALQRLTDLTAQNTQQIQALAQAMNNQQVQAGTASQQLQELAQSVSQQQRAITEATQATNTALSQQAELTANAVAATGKLTADAVTALSQHAESRRPGEVDLHKMIKSPEVFGPTTYKEERDGFLEFRLKMRSWIGALNNDILEKINAVEMESDLHQRIEVILDSGADDAQGKAIKAEGRRMLNLTFFDDDGSFCRIQEAFTVASVINPLMAIGKLFREGWELRVNEEEGMCLTDGSSRIPVHLHKNSLAAQTPSRSKGYTSSNYKMVRTVVQLNKHIQEAVNREEPGWHNTDSMVIVKCATQSSYENPSLMYSPTHFPYRSTLVKEERGWRAVEVSRKYSEKADPFEEFAEGEKEVVTAISAKPIPLWILGTPYAAGDRADQESHGRDYWKMDLEKGEVVRHHVVPRTVLFDPTGVSNCPVLLGDLENSRYTQGDCIYSTEIYEHSDDWRADRLPLREHFRLPWFGQTRFRVKPEVVEDLKAEAAAEELKKKKEEHYKEKEASAVPAAEEESKDEDMREAQADQEAPQEVVEVLEESFYHEGVEYTAQKSSLKELQALCREYGVKTTGSKKQLLRRLATAVREERLNTQHKEQREHHQAYHLAPPQEPTEEERAYHNLTHLPYQPWCPHCVNRAEEADGYLNMPHDDEVYEADDEFLYVPVDFFDEEKGPPNVDPAFLQKLDDEATENVPLVDSEQELHKWLTTKLVKDWRFREATGFEVDEATAGITKLVPMLALANNWAIYSVDVKDAFLQEQPERSPGTWCWKLGRVLPGQRDASSLWSVFCDGPLVEEKFERCTAVPALYRLLRQGKVVAVCIVHVDDLQFAGKKEVIEPILRNLKKTVNLQVEGPLLNEEDYEKGFSEETVKFLKRKYTYEHHELRVHSDNKYVKKLVEILKLEKKKAKNSPCTPASQEPDVSQELDEEHSRTYRSCVGILLYVAHDRPDIQFAVRSLSTAMTKPTERKRKELEHLALYLKGTSDYAERQLYVTAPKNHKNHKNLENNHVNVYSKFLVNYDVDSFDEAKKEVTERAEKLKKVEESPEKEKEEFEDEKKQFEEEKKEASEEKTKFEETVKRFLAKQKEVKEKEDKEQAKTLSEKETALEEAEEKVKEREAEVGRKSREVEKKERKAQERTTGYDEEREEYAKKYVDNAKKDLERELKVLKQEEKVRNQKLDDLQYDYKSLKDDYQYFKGYSLAVDPLLRSSSSLHQLLPPRCREQHT
ncbi:RE1 [Symbiodinium sp. CCMP2592]|nr:RE1 [Symbiodinium sp. CCMP2592]